MEQIKENPYYQYFIGLPGYQNHESFVPSLPVEFRKRLNDDVMMEINEMIIAYNTPEDPEPGGSGADGPAIAPAIIRKECLRTRYTGTMRTFPTAGFTAYGCPVLLLEGPERMA